MTQAMNAQTVKHIASLARLNISEEEAQKFSGEFSAIIAYFNMLNEADVAGVPPAFELFHEENVLREDVALPSMSREEFLKNAPKVVGEHVATLAVWSRH